MANKVGIGFFDQNDDNAGTLIYQAPEQIQSSSYGKKIDIWATGMIMYEILTKGGHPVLGDDFKNDLKVSLQDYKKQMMTISINDVIIKEKSHISQLAVKLLQNLLNVSPNQRYGAPRALKHPWVTRDVNAKIPMNMFEEIQMSMRVYEKLKLAQRVALTMSILNERIIKKSTNEFSEKNTRRVIDKTKVSVEGFSDDEKENCENQDLNNVYSRDHVSPIEYDLVGIATK